MGKQEITKTTLRCPSELWRRVRIRAIQDGISVQDLMIAALREYLKGKGN